LLQSFVRKDRAQGVDDLRKSCACGRGPHNRIEQREIVNRPRYRVAITGTPAAISLWA